MRSRTATWFECKVRYEKVMDDGLQKKVTEQYVVDALSFSEAEKRIIEEMSAYISGEFEVTDVKKAQYKEVFFDDTEMSDRYYKAKLAFITIDERTEKEKRSAVTYLVQAATLDGAVTHINEVMDGTMIDYEKSNIAETKIMDVFEYKKQDEHEGE
jgi:antitoxin component YwqK of YwqJK toxin-antitoxin module